MWDLWDNKHADLCIKISEERVRRINGWKLLKPKERNRYPGIGNNEGAKQMNPNRPTPTYIIIKTAKGKEKIIKDSRENKS